MWKGICNQINAFPEINRNANADIYKDRTANECVVAVRSVHGNK